jgi:hypothetical protein
MTVKALIDFKRLPDADLAAKANMVDTHMTNNPAYPGAHALVLEVREANTLYKQALAADKKAEKKLYKKMVEDELTTLCNYVNFHTPTGDRAMLLLTGFSVSSGERQVIHTKPLKNLKVVNGINRGTVKLTATKGAGTTGVLVEYAIAETLQEITQWVRCRGNTCRRLVEGLPSGKNVFFRAYATGRRNQQVVSDPVCTIIL